MPKMRNILALGAGIAAIAVTTPASAQYSRWDSSQPYGSYSQSYGTYSQPYGSYSQSYGTYSQPYGTYSQPYGTYSQSYGTYAQPYGSYANPYGQAVNTTAATQQCTAAVQSRLYNRRTIGGILGAILGANTSGQVIGVTQVVPRRDGTATVRGLASSGRYAMNGYGPYGVGAYGALGYNNTAAADLNFRCRVGPDGSVYDVSITRR